MEEAYGVGVTNRYALFLDEDGDFDAASLQKGAAAVAGAKGAKPAPGAKAQVGKPAFNDPKSNAPANKDQSRARKPSDRNNNQTARPQGQENRNVNRSPRTYEGGDNVDRQGKDGRRGGFRGGRTGTRGASRPDGAGRKVGDRRSGSNQTGVKSTEKREGSGAHNWGRAEDFRGEEENAAPAEQAENNENAQPAENAEEHVEAAPVDDEPPTKTLEDFKREREEKRLAINFNTRKAGEGEDKTKWKKTYVLQKKPAEDDEEVEYEEIEVEEDSKKGNRRKLLDIDVAFKPSEDTRAVDRRGRGGFGGRGGGRGGGPPREGNRSPRGDAPPTRGSGFGSRGGRGGPRGGRFQATPRVDDYTDFPSL